MVWLSELIMGTDSQHHEVVIWYSKPNRYSFAVLVGAMEVVPELRDVPIHIVSKYPKIEAVIKEILGRKSVPVVAFSLFSTHRKKIFSIIEALKHQFQSQIIIVAGGPHPTAKPQDLLDHGANYVIRGEGEESFPKFIKDLNKGTMNLHKIPGLCWLSPQGKVLQNKRNPPVNLNHYPPFAPQHLIFSPFEISRGCPGGCKYCQVTPLFGRKMRHREVEKLDHAARKAVKMRYRRLWLLSPNSFAYGSRDGITPNPTATATLLEALTSIPKLSQVYFGTFPSEVRPDSVTQEMLEILSRYAANRNIIVGAQTGSDRLLQYIGREHTVNDIIAALSLITDAEMTADVDFIFGLPSENADDQERTRMLINQIVKQGHRIHAHTFLPLPGTAFELQPPGEVDGKTRQLLGTLSRNKQVYGSWSHQVLLAKNMQNNQMEFPWETPKSTMKKKQK